MSGRPAPRPKRGGEEFARTHHLQNPGSSSKKPRFDIRNPSALVPDAPEEDVILEADEIGKRGTQVKRNAVNIDGYDSDSSNEGFNARAAVKAKQVEEFNSVGASKEEATNDMFEDLDEGVADGNADGALAREGRARKKDVRFVEVDEIEGQVLGSKSGGHISSKVTDGSVAEKVGWKPKQVGEGVESSSDSDVGDEVRAEMASDLDEEIGAGGKKKHAPKLDAFNLRAEKEDGGFDEQLNYVRKAADPDAVHDTWLQGVSKKDMKKAKEAEDKREQERRQKIREADAVLTSDLLKSLILNLDRTESVLEALARLGRLKDKKKPRWLNKNKNKRKGLDEMEVDAEKFPEDPAESKRREAVEAITEAADQLLTRGQNEIYDAERESLIRQWQRETEEPWIEPPKQLSEDFGDTREVKNWEYRWSDARDGGEAHGPYEGTMMESWNNAGYFGEGVEFRPVGDQDEAWSRSVDFV
ncbi:hypothetical protein MMC26_003600 [Xylographa opegraphella]|nr:hypothetical protein [Xylographa opegraphella]